MSREHGLWHGGQPLQLQPAHSHSLLQQQGQQRNMVQQQQQQQQQQPSASSQPPSPAATDGVWGPSGPGLGQRFAPPPRGSGLGSPPPPLMQGPDHEAVSAPGGYGIALSPQGPVDGSPFLGGPGSGSPVGYGLDGGNRPGLRTAGFERQHFSVHAAVQHQHQHQGHGGGDGQGHHAHLHQGRAGQVRYPRCQGPASFPGGSPRGIPHGGGGAGGGGGGLVGMSWAPGTVEHSLFGGGGGGGGVDGVSGRAVEAAAEERSTEPPLHHQNRQHHSLGQHESSSSYSGTPYQPNHTNGVAPCNGGDASHSPAETHAPVPMPIPHEIRRQSSLPHLSGAQTVLMPARMAQTPPANLSGVADFMNGGEVGGSPPQDSGTDVLAAVAAAISGRGATEAWERERSRFSARGFRSSPTESRVAAANAVQNAAPAASAGPNGVAAPTYAGAGGSDAASTVSLANTDSTARSAATAAAESARGPAPAGSEPMESARYSCETREPDAAAAAAAAGVEGGALGEPSLRDLSLEGDGDRAALPGLNDFASIGHR